MLYKALLSRVDYMEVSVAQEGLHNQVKNVKITAVDGGSLRGELEE